LGILDPIITFLDRLGGKTIEVTEKPLQVLPTGKTVQERLQLLRQLQKEIQREKEAEVYEKEAEEIIEWRKEELQKPFTERLAEAFLKRFKGPIDKITYSMKGIEEDLFRANIFMSKEKYVALMIVVSIFASFFTFIVGLLFYLPFSTSALLGILGFLGGFFYMRQYPRMVWKKRVVEVERALPYALRHMAALLSAGVGISEAMLSVAQSDYGAISEEFELIIRDMRTGASFEEALERFERKMSSENVTRVVKQILRAVKFGGNLADVLYKLAEDFAFEYRMKLVEYVQKVNGIAFIYMFMTIVLPTMFMVGVLAASVMGQSMAIPTPTLALIMLFAFPTLSFIVVQMIKKGEPR